MRLSVVGAGYVGLVLAACFAERGYRITVADRDGERVQTINRAVPPFHEAGLEDMLKRSVLHERLRATTDCEECLKDSDFTFIAVGTPGKPNGSIDLGFVEDACVEIGRALRKRMDYHVVTVRSTVIPGTTEGLIKPVIQKHSGKKAGRDFGLVMQPEFLREGSAVYDMMNPDRIIIGEHDAKSGDLLEGLYREFHKGKLPPTLRTNISSAEMIKYASNTFLATKISFINELAHICEKVPGVDVVEVARGMGLDRRIGSEFLRAGAGFGGSCFPKDLRAMIAFARKNRYEPRIMESALKVNLDQTTHVVKLAKNRLGTLAGKRIAVLGLSFKPGTDDLREAPSQRIIEHLLKEGASVVAYDPVALRNAEKIWRQRIDYAPTPSQCLDIADAAVIVTEWEEFRRLAPSDFKRWMRQPVIIDARRIYAPAEFHSETTYCAIGLGSQSDRLTNS